MCATLTKVTKLVSNLSAADVGALPAAGKAVDSAKLEGKSKSQVVTEARVGLVLDSTTINKKPLTGNIVLTPTDVGASAVGHTHEYIPLSSKAVANGVATLDAGAKIPQNQLPALAITDTHVVDTEAKQLALAAQVGDICVRTDLHITYILAKEPATAKTSWQKILAPSDQVSSVNGMKGAVILNSAHVGAEPAFGKKSAFNKDFGAAAGTVAQGNDPRIVNAVPNSRKINSKTLNTDVVLNAADVGALAVAGKAVDSAKLEGKSKAQVVAEARTGLALAGASYTKAESDGRYALSGNLVDSLKELILTFDVTTTSAGTTVTIPSGKVSAVLFLSVNGAMQNSDVWTLSGTTLTFGETISSGSIITVIGFK